METTRENIEGVQRIGDALTERDLAQAREILASISAKHPNGFTLLSHLTKIPKSDDPNDYVYEYQLSQPIAEFMIKIREKYPDADLASAVCGKILSELFKSNELSDIKTDQ